MLSKKYRLNRKQINQIYRKGSGRKLGEIGVKFLENRGSFSRFAVVIPKAVVKKATERNRARRIIFEELGQNKPLKNTDIIIRLFKVIPEADLRQNLKEVIKKIS